MHCCCSLILYMTTTGERSVARRLLRCAASLLSDGQMCRALNAADTAPQIQAAMRRYAASYPQLQRLADVVVQQVDTPQVCIKCWTHFRCLIALSMCASTAWSGLKCMQTVSHALFHPVPPAVLQASKCRSTQVVPSSDRKQLLCWQCSYAVFVLNLSCFIL